jgi:PAS domain S-box-containing protein
MAVDVQSLARSLLQPGLVFALVVIMVMSALAYRSLDELEETSESAEYAQDILFGLERLSSLLKDAETGQRGFLLTGETEFLDPYHDALAETPRALAHLRELTAGDPVRRQRLDALEPLVQQRLERLERGIAARIGERPVRVDELQQGKTVMDQMRSVVADMIEEKRRSYSERRAGAAWQAAAAGHLLMAGAFGSILIILTLFYMTNREVQRRRAAELTLQAANIDLELRVRGRTADLEAEAQERGRIAQMFRAVIDEAPFAIIGLAPDRKVAIWNRSAERIFGYHPDDVIGRPYPLVPPGGEAEFDNIIERSAAGERLRGFSVKRQRKDGRLVDIVFSGAPLYDEGGKLRIIVFILEDVTERLALEGQLRQAQRMEAIGQLTGGIAHDFNNLLGIVIGNLDLAVKRKSDDAELAELIEDAMKGAARGAELTQRLLAFGRRQTLKPQVIDLNARLPSVAALLRRTLGENIEIVQLPAEGLWSALVDPSQVEDALVNLAINARDAMPDGGTLTIETGNVRLDQAYADQNREVTSGLYVMIAVTDTGTGMAPEVVERAFEPFFTTKDVGRGTGLGLSMIYGFAKQSNGHVKIYSELGHGTTVKLYLPRADGASAGEAASSAADAEVPGGSETVLVVEDNPDMRQTARRQLAGLGYTVLEADNAESALAVLGEGRPIDLLFTDIVMPGPMSGYALAEQARALYPAIRILYTSGYAEGSMRNGKKAHGPAAPMLGKPYRHYDLARMVRYVLDGTA